MMSKHVDIDDVKIKLVVLNNYYTTNNRNIQQIISLIDSLAFDCALLFKDISQKYYNKRILKNQLWVIKQKRMIPDYINQVFELNNTIETLIQQILDEKIDKQSFINLLFQEIDKYQNQLQLIHEQVG